MDLHQLLGSVFPCREISFKFASTSSSLYSKWFRPMKFNISNLPHTPLSGDFDFNTYYALSNSQGEYNWPERVSGISFPCNSSLIGTIPMGPGTDKSLAASCLGSDESKEKEVQKPRWRSPSFKSHHEFPTIQYPYITIKYQKVYHGVLPDKCRRDMMGLSQGDVKQLLIACSTAFSENEMENFEMLLQETRGIVSICGEPIQRLGAYMLEGLVARQKASGTTIYHALQSKEPESRDLLSYMQILYDICPYFKFGYLAANGAIAEAVRKEDWVHIIDFQIAQGTQWVALIQALAARPGGPPHVRITGIGDPVSKCGQGNDLCAVGEKLSMLAQKFNIPLEFCPVQVCIPEVTRDMLDIRPGEALAVNFTFHLHHTPDEGVDVKNPRDGLLRMVKGLSPKVTTLVEQESNTNTTPFLTRFTETLDYYSAIFESIDVTLPRESKERILVEQHCLAKDIVNIIACEGKDRVERHELLGKWKLRLAMAGFKPHPLSSFMNSVIRALLRSYSDKYTLVEKDGAIFLGWKNRNLISASAWH